MNKTERNPAMGTLRGGSPADTRKREGGLGSHGRNRGVEELRIVGMGARRVIRAEGT